MLIEKLGDNNPRVRDTARDAILALVRVREGGLRGMTGALLKPPKTQTAWRPVLSMLQLLQELVPVLGVGAAGMASSSGGANSSSAGGAATSYGFDVGELMEYLGRAFNSANADVRAAAVKVTVVAVELGGPAVRRRIPRDINPKIKEQLDAALGMETSAGGWGGHSGWAGSQKYFVLVH